MEVSRGLRTSLQPGNAGIHFNLPPANLGFLWDHTVGGFTTRLGFIACRRQTVVVSLICVSRPFRLQHRVCLWVPNNSAQALCPQQPPGTTWNPPKAAEPMAETLFIGVPVHLSTHSLTREIAGEMNSTQRLDRT